MIVADIIKGPEGIIRYYKEWNEIFYSYKNEPSTSLEWTKALLKNHLSERDKFLLVVFKNCKKVTGIVPLIVNITRKYGQTLTTIFPISELYNTHSDILFREFSDEMTRVFVKTLFNLEYRWDIFRMKRIVEKNRIIDSIESCLKENKVNYKLKREQPSFFLTLDSTFDDYLKKRSGKFRNYLERMKKKITAAGGIKFYKVEDFNSINDAYRALLEVEKKSWKHEHGTAISSIKRQEEFYKELCISTYGAGWLHLLFLYLNNKPIAYNMGLLKDNKYYYIKTSFDNDLRRFSPSTLLRAELIKGLINDGIRYFDFPGEPYEWERQWTEELQRHKSLEIYNNTLKGGLCSIYRTFKNRKNRQSGEDLIQYYNPKDLKP